MLDRSENVIFIFFTTNEKRADQLAELFQKLPRKRENAVTCKRSQIIKRFNWPFVQGDQDTR